MAQSKLKDYGSKILVLALAVVAGAVFLYTRSWLQAVFSDSPRPESRPWQPPVIEHVDYDWENPLLPAGSSIDFRTLSGNEGRRRLQVMASSVLKPEDVMAFYEHELVRDGWNKYNGGKGLQGRNSYVGTLFHKGDLSLAVHVYALSGSNGSRFRLGVVRMPADRRSQSQTPADLPAAGGNKKD